MSLADALSTPPKAKIQRCAVGRTIDSLSSADGNALVAALLDPQWTATAILNVLRAEGHHVGHSTVLRHRKGECTCESV